MITLSKISNEEHVVQILFITNIVILFKQNDLYLQIAINAVVFLFSLKNRKDLVYNKYFQYSIYFLIISFIAI